MRTPLRDPRRRPSAGFTLLELMVVMTIMIILIGMAAGNYQRHVLRSKETVLKSNLRVMREAIDQYTLDKQQAPQSLEELVAGGYLRNVPRDPITGQRNWRTEYCDALLSPDQLSTGICDVRSTSDAVSPFEGTPYSSW